jgi:hypothetical protein
MRTPSKVELEQLWDQANKPGTKGLNYHLNQHVKNNLGIISCAKAKITAPILNI